MSNQSPPSSARELLSRSGGTATRFPLWDRLRNPRLATDATGSMRAPAAARRRRRSGFSRQRQVLAQRGHGLRRQVARGRESHPLRTLLVAANRMVKPNVAGCGNGAYLRAEMGSSALADA
jgi:hypothetical protein